MIGDGPDSADPDDVDGFPWSPGVPAVAKLVTERGEELCLLRYLALPDATIQIYAELQAGEAVRLELISGEYLSGSVLSRRDSLAKLQLQPDPVRVRSDQSASPSPPRPRLPRLEVGLPAQLRIEGHQAPAILCNISQGGAKIRAAGLGVGLKVGLLVGGLPPLIGRVRWIKDDSGGMSFYEAVPLDLLAPWSAALGAKVNADGRVIPMPINHDGG